MNKTIEVIPYDAAWPHLFQQEADLIKNALGQHCVAVHHIGSTSVPRLSAKRDIDIMCLVDQLSASLALQHAGYVCKGELNIPFRYFFSKNTPQSKVNLHVVEPDHAFVSLNLLFRDYLRQHADARRAYASLKEELSQNPDSGQQVNPYFRQYSLGKDHFVKDILNRAGFNDLCVNFCAHFREWETYHRIREDQIFAPIGIFYDRNHPTLTAAGHYHFVLYHSTTIVAVAHIELLTATDAVLRSLATDEIHKRQGHGSYLLQFIEKWVASQGRHVMKLHSNLRAEPFYRRRGYDNMPFDDVALNPEVVDLGKKL